MTNNCKPDQYVDVCKAQFNIINAKLDLINDTLRGNGKLGYNVRIDRLEMSAAARTKFWWIIATAVVTGMVSIVVCAITLIWRM